ncbi:MAG: transglycosylase SLT domain-containing protein [Flavobacteriales bacterium]|nr:transglycosylase SLT domain-containing protein [Flavobacteriales bacterium]MCB9447506.1 transglycosylase SLT domain-containing protein [Flavobacteriales bacterium]
MLLQELNRWLHQTKRKPAYYTLYRKYFLSPKASSERMNSEYSSLSGGKISAFDDDIRKFSQRIDWDWRLLAAQIYQESHFNPEARSWAGAYGLTQLMPGTARQMGFDTITTASQSIEAGVKLIEKLDNYWQTYVEDKDERIKFILASYNVGLGHVVDARQLAIKNHYNPNVWFGQVDKFLILKSQPKYFKDPVVKYGYCRGDEPVKYVQDILNRYEHYCNNIGQTEPEIHSHNFAQTPR